MYKELKVVTHFPPNTGLHFVYRTKHKLSWWSIWYMCTHKHTNSDYLNCISTYQSTYLSIVNTSRQTCIIVMILFCEQMNWGRCIYIYVNSTLNIRIVMNHCTLYLPSMSLLLQHWYLIPVQLLKCRTTRDV